MSTSRSCRFSTASLPLLFLVGCLLLKSSCSWTTAPSFRRTINSLQASSPGGDEEPDLFEYFDPLLSPHEYPNGISPDNSKLDAFPVKPAPLEEYGQGSAMPSINANGSDNQKEEEPFPDEDDLFDPRISPHAYPNGVDSKSQPQEDDERYNPLKFRMFQKNMQSQQNTPVASSSSTISGKAGSGSGKVGILLMDHGSRNEASNQRLEHLAELYKLTMQDDNVVVLAAHMEIAKPTIPDGLQALLDQGVDEIICHPYFLSPGRHVREDIPQIIEEAIASLQIEIPVITTDPLGTNTQLMLGAIHSLVRENSQLLKSKNP